MLYSLPTPNDILFISATIVAGDDTPPYVSDVLLSNGLVARIDPLLHSSTSPQLKNATRVDATGHILCPGFIDLHAHSDLYLLTSPEHEPKISQGCTVSPGFLILKNTIDVGL